jgi:hypothetical protein
MAKKPMKKEVKKPAGKKKPMPGGMPPMGGKY